MSRLGHALAGFGAFWWDFIVGDDWVIAAGIVVGIVVTALLVHVAGAPGWWVLPVAVLLTLVLSLLRGVRTTRP